MRIWAEVYTADGTRQGIANLISCDVSSKLDALAQVQLSLPMTDTSAHTLLQIGRRVKLYEERNSRQRYIGLGVLQQRQLMDAGPTKQITWTGYNALEELRQPYVGRGRAYENTDFTAIAEALIGLVDGWTVSVTDTLTYPNTTIRFDGCTIFAAFKQMIKRKGVHLRLTHLDRQLELGTFGTDSGVRIFNPKRQPHQLAKVTDVALIGSLQQVRDAFDVVNWIEPIAGGTGGTAPLSLKRTTRTSPYTVQSMTGPDGRTIYYLEDSTSISLYGTIQRVFNAPSIIPIDISSSSAIYAADMLYDYASAFLSRRAQPQVSYRVEVRKLDKSLKPGDKVHLAYWGEIRNPYGQVVDYGSVDGDFWILGIEESYSQQGQLAILTLSNIDIELQSAEAWIAEGLAEVQDGSVGIRLQSQSSPSEYTVAVSPSAAGTISLTFAAETVELGKALLTIERDNFMGPDTITVTVDGETVTTSVDGQTTPFLGGTSWGDSVTLDIEDYLTDYPTTGVDIQDTHTIEISCLYHAGNLSAKLDLVEITAVAQTA